MNVNSLNAFLIDAHLKIVKSGKYNFRGKKILLPWKFNFKFIEEQLVDYHDKEVVGFLKYEFPADCVVSDTNPGIPDNHVGAQ